MILTLALLLLPTAAVGHVMTGGISDTTVSATDEPVVFAVKAIKEQFAQNNGPSALSGGLDLVKIIHARRQVVAGEKLYLTLQLTGDYYCDVTVWYRVWLQGVNRLQITDGPTCRSEAKSTTSGSEGGTAASSSAGTPLLGGGGGGVGGLSGREGILGGIGEPAPLPPPGHPDHDTVHRALGFAACAVNDGLNSPFAVTLAFPFGVRYTEQVTSGMTYRFYNVPMVPTTCPNEGCARLDLTSCPAKLIGRQIRRCKFQVQYQAWMEPQYNLTDVAC